MKYIYCITGPRGSGKSTAVARFLPPSKHAQQIIIDTEDSMSDILDNNERLGTEFGAYIRMYDRLTKGQREDVLSSIAAGRLPWINTSVKQSALVSYYEYFVNTLAETLKDNLADGKPKLTYLGIDTIEPIEAALSAWVETHRQQAGWSGIRAYGRRETEGVRPLYENILEACHVQGVRDFCLASHLKPVWEETGPKSVRRVPNKVQIGGRIVVLSRLSSQMWWLVPNVGNPDGAPAAIRLKARYGAESIDKDNDRWVTRTMLPRRIPHFTWWDVREYQKNGCDLVNPAPGEAITKAEREMISEFLTQEQMRLMVLGAEMELRGRVDGQRAEALPAPQAAFSLPGKENGIVNNAVNGTIAEIVQEIGRLRPASDEAIKARLRERYKLPDIIKAFRSVDR